MVKRHARSSKDQTMFSKMKNGSWFSIVTSFSFTMFGWISFWRACRRIVFLLRKPSCKTVYLLKSLQKDSSRTKLPGLIRVLAARKQTNTTGQSRAEQDEEQSNDTNRGRQGRDPYRGRRNPIPARRGLCCPAVRWRGKPVGEVGGRRDRACSRHRNCYADPTGHTGTWLRAVLFFFFPRGIESESQTLNWACDLQTRRWASEPAGWGRISPGPGGGWSLAGEGTLFVWKFSSRISSSSYKERRLSPYGT